MSEKTVSATDFYAKYVASSRRDTKNLSERVLKLVSEVGELADCVLAINDVATLRYKKLNVDSLVEEAVDVVLCINSVLQNIVEVGGVPMETVCDVFTKKTERWEKIMSDAGLPSVHEESNTPRPIVWGVNMVWGLNTKK